MFLIVHFTFDDSQYYLPFAFAIRLIFERINNITVDLEYTQVNYFIIQDIYFWFLSLFKFY